MLLLIQQLWQSDNFTDFFPKVYITLRQILDIPLLQCLVKISLDILVLLISVGNSMEDVNVNVRNPLRKWLELEFYI